MKYVLIIIAIAAALFITKNYAPRIAGKIRSWLIQPAIASVAAAVLKLEKSSNTLKGEIGKIALEEDAVETITAGVIESIVAQLPDAIDEAQQQKLDGLRAMVKKLRAERDNPWVQVVVRLHGLQMGAGSVAGGKELHARVLVNRNTGDVKAAKNREIEHEGSSYRRMSPASDLGAPAWSRVQGDAWSIVMCGELYTYKY